MGTRNSKGQVLLEAVFLVAMVVTLLLVFQGLIENHRSQIKKAKISRETFRDFEKKDSQ